MGKVRVGLSGWSYDEWRGRFYPEDLPRGDELEYASRRFETLEINGTFYRLADPESCRVWRDTAPQGFKYAVKGSRYITHTRRLTGVRHAVANFLASGILELGSALGPILWQLPPDLTFDGQALNGFLGLLPHDTEAAVSLAKEHDDRVEETSYGNGANHRVRHVIEARHDSFLDAGVARIAREHGVALAISHSSEWPVITQLTAGFVYVRLHGPRELYASRYPDTELERWAERIETWHGGGVVGDLQTISDLGPPERKERDVYVYFNNTDGGFATEDCERLSELLHG